MTPKEILGISGEVTREILCEKYIYFSTHFKKQDPKTFLKMEAAYKTLLQEQIEQELNTRSFKIRFYLSISFVTGGWTYIYMHMGPSSYWSIALGLIAAYFILDLLSGCAHIMLDHLLRFDTPIIGPVAKGFNLHHLVPTDLTYITLAQLIKPVIVTAYPVLTVLGLLSYLIGSSFGIWLFFGTTCLSLFGQPIHRLAHMETPSQNRFIRFLQRYHIILAPEDHQSHHRDGEQTHFCIFSGQFNTLLNKIAPFILKRYTVKDK